MNAAEYIPASDVQIKCVECAATIRARSKTMARNWARKHGWKQPGGRNHEMHICPDCYRTGLDRAKEKELERINVQLAGGTEREKIETQALRQAEKRLYEQRSVFDNAFGRILSSAEMTACANVRKAIEKFETSGNACMSYDGVSITGLTFGSKSIQESVLDASDYLRRCQTQIVGYVQMYHHDAWQVFYETINRDMNVEQAAARFRYWESRDQSRATIRSLVEKSANIIKDIPYKVKR